MWASGNKSWVPLLKTTQTGFHGDARTTELQAVMLSELLPFCLSKNHTKSRLWKQYYFGILNSTTGTNYLQYSCVKQFKMSEHALSNVTLLLSKKKCQKTSVSRMFPTVVRPTPPKVAVETDWRSGHDSCTSDYAPLPFPVLQVWNNSLFHKFLKWPSSIFLGETRGASRGSGYFGHKPEVGRGSVIQVSLTPKSVSDYCVDLDLRFRVLGRFVELTNTQND